MAAVSDISVRQNNSDSITLMRAISVTHQRAQRAQTLSLLLSIALAVCGIAGSWLPRISDTLTVLGAGWAVIYATLVVPWSRRRMGQSAVLQEMFDVAVLQLPWNPVIAGDPVPTSVVSQLSRRFRGAEARLRDYYLAAAAPFPLDLLFCLEQNLAWGPRVRLRFARAMKALVALFCIVGLAVGLFRRMTVGDLLTVWFIPSLGLLLFCLDIYRAQVAAVSERGRVLGLLYARRAEPVGRYTDAEWTTFGRQVQDTIFVSRQQQTRVPNWFFRWLHDSDQADFRRAQRQWESMPQRTST
jgi:hypothetical protein